MDQRKTPCVFKATPHSLILSNNSLFLLALYFY